MWLSTSPVAFPGGFSSVFQLNACAYASLPSEAYNQVPLEPDFSHAILGAGKSGCGWWGWCAGQPLAFL